MIEAMSEATMTYRVKRPTDVQNDEIITWLEWAGAKLIAMPGRRVRPAEPTSLWVDYVQDIRNTDEFRQRLSIRAMAPSAEEITVMDAILPLPSICAEHTTRRVIHARSLVHPVNNRHLYRWTRIAKLLHTDRRTVRRWHHAGIDEIARKIEPDIVHTLRQYFSSPPIPS